MIAIQIVGALILITILTLFFANIGRIIDIVYQSFIGGDV